MPQVTQQKLSFGPHYLLLSKYEQNAYHPLPHCLAKLITLLNLILFNHSNYLAVNSILLFTCAKPFK